MKDQFIYSPKIAQEFRCKVPLKETRQLFEINGVVQGTGKPFSLVLKENEVMQEMLQLISVRASDDIHPVFGDSIQDDGKTEELSFANRYEFGKNSQGRILLCSHTFSLDRFKTVEKVSIKMDEGAAVQFIVMQNEHNKSLHDTFFDIEMDGGCSLQMVFLSLHGGEITNNLRINMNGEHSDCELSGLYLTDSKQSMTTRVELNHNKPGCRSNQLFKGILDDQGIARFYGKIKVAYDSQKTEAYQANHNLLLSDGAVAYSEPQLEIYADDVKCSHGATIGRLNDDELFYMRTRGIPEAEARLLQQMAFAYEVLSKVSNEELRERMRLLVEKRLRGEFSQCKNCSKNCC